MPNKFHVTRNNPVIKYGRTETRIADLLTNCPPAPYEALMLNNDLIVKSGKRDRINIDLFIPSALALPVGWTQGSQAISKFAQ